MTDQPPPQKSSGDVWKLVITDMEERRQLGIKRYGTPVQPHNGRDALIDAYQEVLDTAVYLRQAIEERHGGNLNSELSKAVINMRRVLAGESLDAVYGDDNIGGYTSWECNEYDKDIIVNAYLGVVKGK